MKQIRESRHKRFRKMPGIKQEALAYELGDDWYQKKISLPEQKDTIEVSLLRQISESLKMPVEAIQNFTEEQAINIISNTFDNGSIGYQKNEHCTFNPIDKIVELYESKIALYERMLKEKEEMIEKLVQFKK